MASIVIHSIPAQWKTPVLEIISLFRGNSTLLFEVLTVVPEEFSTQASKNHYFYSIYFFIYFSVFHPYLILIVFCVIFFYFGKQIWFDFQCHQQNDHWFATSCQIVFRMYFPWFCKCYNNPTKVKWQFRLLNVFKLGFNLAFPWKKPHQLSRDSSLQVIHTRIDSIISWIHAWFDKLSWKISKLQGS